MRRGKLLNADVVSLLSLLGHTDQITIADAGLPIPNTVKRIDLALQKGTPSFLETITLLNNEMVIEKILLAEEIKTLNREVHQQVLEIFKGCTVEYLSHDAFKLLTHNSKAIIRTGECTPYANIVFQSGVDFEGA